MTMGLTPRNRKNLEEVLQSVSDVLFPAELGKKLVKIDSRDMTGDTPLHVLIWSKDRYGVNLLIEAGADINAVGDRGEPPLHIAFRQKDISIIESLLRAGAKTYITSLFGETAVQIAARVGGPVEKTFDRHVKGTAKNRKQRH